MAEKRPPKDVNELAAYITRVASGDAEKVEPPKKNAHAQALSKLGASKGGQARKNALTPERRREIAKKAAVKRWSKKPE